MVNFTAVRLGGRKSSINRWWNPQQDKIRKSVICLKFPLPLLAKSSHIDMLGPDSLQQECKTTQAAAMVYLQVSRQGVLANQTKSETSPHCYWEKSLESCRQALAHPSTHLRFTCCWCGVVLNGGQITMSVSPSCRLFQCGNQWRPAH